MFCKQKQIWKMFHGILWNRMGRIPNAFASLEINAITRILSFAHFFFAISAIILNTSAAFIAQKRYFQSFYSVKFGVIFEVSVPWHFKNVIHLPETPLDNIEHCFNYTKELLLCHSVRVGKTVRTPFSCSVTSSALNSLLSPPSPAASL